MIFFIKPARNVEDLRKKVDNFLAERCLNVKEAKTKLVKSTQEFDFLEWQFKFEAKNNKPFSYSSKDNRLKMSTKIKKSMRDTK